MSNMEVTYIDHFGTDLSVVNAARVSFSKRHEEFKDKKDTSLIRFLYREKHFMPFTHTGITLHVKAPIFVARQLAKHEIGFMWSESSRRYVDERPSFFHPKTWRARAENVKQGSDANKVINSGVFVGVAGEKYRGNVTNEVLAFYERAEQLYYDLLENGVCPEQARIILPQSMMTEWIWTGNLAAFGRMYELRADSHTQLETQEIAKKVSEIIRPLYPVSWASITETLL